MKENRRGKLARSVLLEHDNARLHTNDETAGAIAQPGFEIIPHPRCSLDLAPFERVESFYYSIRNSHQIGSPGEI